jgi:hypothetical protein
MLKAWVGLALALAAAPAAAEEAPAPKRWLGELAGLPEGAPRRIVVDAAQSPGYEAFETRLEGWLAVLEPALGGDDFDETCVSDRCAITAGLDAGELAIAADLGGEAAGPVEGRYTYTANGEAPMKGTVRFTPIAGPPPGLSAFAPPDAVSAQQLSAWLDVLGFEQGFTNDFEDGPPGDRERRGLAQWQAARERGGGGLILTDDLIALRTEAEAERYRMFWQNIQGRGWSGSYPAGILENASGAGPDGVGRRFTSAKGDAYVEFTAEPPMSEEAWDAFVEARTADREGRESRGYTRVNDDMEVAYTEGGMNVSEVYHRREGRVVRMVLSYPASEVEAWTVTEPAAVRAFRPYVP